MKILTFINVSNRNRIEADSAYIFYNILSKYFTENNKFIIVSPVALTNKKSIHIYREFGYNKYEVRFSFDWMENEKIIKEIKPDVLLLNQIEQVVNYRALIETIGLKTIIASYAHYIPYRYKDGQVIVDESLNDADLGEILQLKFLSGLLQSDIVFVHSKTARELINELYKKYLKKFDKNKFIINPPPVDPDLLDNNIYPKNKIFYNHRLYKHYGTEVFFEIVKNILNNYKLEINVLDVLGERNEIQNRMDSSVNDAREIIHKMPEINYITDTFKRDRYRDVIQNSLFSIAPYRENCIWAMSCVDSMGMGVPVVAPKFAWFQEFMPPDLCYCNIEEAAVIIEKLIVDKKFWEEKSKQARNSVRNLMPRQVATKFLNVFDNMLK